MASTVDTVYVNAQTALDFAQVVYFVFLDEFCLDFLQSGFVLGAHE